MRKFRTIAALSVAVLIALTSFGRTADTIKGTVVYDGVPPVRKAIDVSASPDKNFCLSKGPVLSDEIVVDPKTKGVRWVMVWLLDEKGGNKLPVNKNLPKPAEKVTLDQPCCSYEPHVFCMQAGQILVCKNSATVPHNVNIIGGEENPNKNILIPAGKSIDVNGWKAATSPVPIQCTIHRWMNCWVRVFDHPYFAVTDEKGEFEIKGAPAGKYRIVVWQESVGWVVIEAGKKGKMGIPIEAKAGVTDLGKIKLTPPPAPKK